MSATCRRHVAATWHFLLFFGRHPVCLDIPADLIVKIVSATYVRTYVSAYILLTTRRKLLPKQRYLLSFLASPAPRFAIRARRLIHVLHKNKTRHQKSLEKEHTFNGIHHYPRDASSAIFIMMGQYCTFDFKWSPGPRKIGFLIEKMHLIDRSNKIIIKLLVSSTNLCFELCLLQDL